MYNKPIYFKGDVVITDPCYFVKDNDPAALNGSPSWWDFVSMQKTEIKNGTEYHHMPKAEDYSDAVTMLVADYIEKHGKDTLLRKSTSAFINYVSNPDTATITFSETFEKEMDEYHKAEEVWHESNADDWEKCEFGENMEALGFTTFISEDTIIGDWGCTVKNLDNNQIIGEFSADAGMVGVFLLDEVMKYNPDFKIEDGIATVIRDFDGKIEITDFDGEVSVRGTGNINFKSYQTSL